MMLITATASALFPALGQGDTVVAVIVSSVVVWIFHFLVLQGVKEAAGINRIVTIAKVVPIVAFIVIALVMFNAGYFSENFWGGDETTFRAVFEQAKGTMLITVFVFIGIEGASVYSRFAKKRSDVGKATVFGFLSVLAVFMLVTLVSYGAMPQDQLATATQPSMAAVLESLVGQWGSVFIRAGVVLSVLGAYLAWTLMAAEILYIPATSNDMPRFLTKVNAKGSPVAALLMVTGLIQALLLVLLFVADALDFMLDLTAALALLPYLMSAGYALKLTLTRETYEDNPSGLRKDMLIALVATLYTAFLVYAAGPDKLLLSCMLYAPGAVLYIMARREKGLRVFSPVEMALFGLIVVGAIAGVIAVATGAMQL
jgi:arginine:ornithine antiporter/lysine permease